MRPVFSQSSAGVSTGISISWPPIASISSRMTWTTFSWTRQPSGMKVQMPGDTWRMKPPRTSSLWLAASASAGSSRSVGRKSFDARHILRLVERDQRRLGHRERRRLRHFQPFRPLHTVFDPGVDLAKSSSTSTSDETFFSTRPCA